MAFRLLIIILVSLFSLRSFKCYGHSLPGDVKSTVLSRMMDEITLSKCRKTRMGALLDKNIVDFLSECDVPIPVENSIINTEQAVGYICLGYFDINLKLCKYFSDDNDMKILLPKTKDEFNLLMMTLDNVTGFCTDAHAAIKPTEFHQTQFAIKPLVSILSDENHCHKVCYDYNEHLKPVCKVLLWANRKLTEYAESRKGHEKISELKEKFPTKAIVISKIETKLLQPLITETNNSALPTVLPTVVNSVQPVSLPKKLVTVKQTDTHVYSQASANSAEDSLSSAVIPPSSPAESSIPNKPAVAKTRVTVENLSPKVPQETSENQPQRIVPPTRVTTQQNKPPLDKQISEEQMASNVNNVGGGDMDINMNGADPNYAEFSHTDELNIDKDLQGQLQSSNSRDPSEINEEHEDPDQIMENPPEMSSSAAAKDRFNGGASGALAILFSSWLIFYYK